jgi:uncharacterized protein (DUF302 family)
MRLYCRNYNNNILFNPNILINTKKDYCENMKKLRYKLNKHLLNVVSFIIIDFNS